VKKLELGEIVKGVEQTKLSYLYDSYSTSFEAKVLNAVHEQGKSWYVVLDQTLFHPKSGGQPTDVGELVIQGVKANVKKAMLVNGVVVHYVKLEKELKIEKGMSVRGTIDWGLRYKYMRRHTAAHLLDHCVNLVTHRINKTLGSWLGEPTYVEYQGIFEDVLLKQVEEKANAFISQGLEVKTEFLPKDALKEILDSPNTERLPEIQVYRIVQIDSFEKIPCGGTHVKNTKEIGALTLKKTEKVEGGFRIYFEV
jgi:alanyl-tRNA synthetase